MTTQAEVLKVGFIGCGGFAQQSIWPSLRYAPLDVAWAFSRDIAKAEVVARRFGAQRATNDLEDVLRDNSVGAVFVVGPPQMQLEVTDAAIRAGKHVFVEKPPAPDAPGTLRLAQAAAEKGVQVQVGFQKRFATAYQLVKKQAASLGNARVLKVNYAHWKTRDWRHHMTILGIHGVDLARYFLGNPDLVHIYKRSDPDGFNTCVLTFEYRDGATAVINLSATEPHVQEWVEFSGGGEMLTVRNQIEMRHWAAAPNPADSLSVNAATVESWQPEFAIPYQQADSLWIQGYAGEVKAFAEAVLFDRPVEVSIDDAAIAMAIAREVELAPEGMSTVKFGDF